MIGRDGRDDDPDAAGGADEAEAAAIGGEGSEGIVPAGRVLGQIPHQEGQGHVKGIDPGGRSGQHAQGLEQLQTLLETDVAYAFLYHTPDETAFHDYVKGYVPIPEMRYLETVWLDR
ncbi:MAG: hypothetical protein M3Q71_22840 [Chloroflexota bacterium]|nr:hypothetical protein [Chloroflexota bacterium]